jgi:hypothetical protein
VIPKNIKSLTNLQFRHDAPTAQSDAAIILQRDENPSFRIAKSFAAQQGELLTELDQKRDILRFLAAARGFIA